MQRSTQPSGLVQEGQHGVLMSEELGFAQDLTVLGFVHFGMVLGPGPP